MLFPNFKYAGCGKISQHLWLFSSFPEIRLPTLLIRSAHDVPPVWVHQYPQAPVTVNQQNHWIEPLRT